MNDEPPRPAELLERELYWLADRAAAPPGPLRELRRRLEHLTDTLRADLSRPFPAEDPALEAGTGWRRAVKRFLYRFLRPFLRRHDRLAGELAATSLELLDHVARAEADLRRLEDEVLRLRGGDRPSPEDRPPGQEEAEA